MFIIIHFMFSIFYSIYYFSKKCLSERKIQTVVPELECIFISETLKIYVILLVNMLVILSHSMVKVIKSID